MSVNTQLMPLSIVDSTRPSFTKMYNRTETSRFLKWSGMKKETSSLLIS